jgi:glycerophosphoryl diester phosphodiesterase
MNRPKLRRYATLEIVGHGGAGDFYPGNSQPSIEKALELGVDRIEIDVQRSRDGDLVLVHDERVRVDGGKPTLVSNVSTSALQSMFPGFLTLPEAIEIVGGRVPWMLDIKGPGFEQDLIAAIKNYRLAADSSVSCTHVGVLRRLRREFPEMRLGLSTGHWSRGAPTFTGKKIVASIMRPSILYPLLAALPAAGATEIMIFHHACSRSLVEGLHNRGYLVNVWTVDRPASIRRALDLNVDGIITNRPDLLHEEIAVRQAPRA